MTEFVAAIVGAIVGSGIGGLISFLLQSAALKAAKAERDDRAHEQKLALAHSLIFKIILIFNNLANLKLHVNECKDRAIRVGDEGLPVTFLMPILNVPEPVTLDEMR